MTKLFILTFFMRQAKDVEGAANVAHVLVHVAVMDVNDNEPVFINRPYHALVSTMSLRGHVVTKVSMRLQVMQEHSKLMFFARKVATENKECAILSQQRRNIARC